MDVGRISSQPTDSLTPISQSVPTEQAVAGDKEDSIDVLTPQISNLLSAVSSGDSGHAGKVQEMLQSVGNAVLQHDVTSALGHVTSLIEQHPEEFESLPSQPTFAPIRSELNNLLRTHLTATRARAQESFSVASRAVEAGEGNPRARAIDGAEVLSAAHRLLDSGKYANLRLASELSQTVINAYVPVPVIPLVESKSNRNRSEQIALGIAIDDLMRSTSVLYRRVPMLSLFLAWLALGIMSGLFTFLLQLLEFEGITGALTFEIWGAGSVGLIGYGTYKRLAKKKS